MSGRRQRLPEKVIVGLYGPSSVNERGGMIKLNERDYGSTCEFSKPLF